MNQTVMVFEILRSAMQYSGVFALHEASSEQKADHAHLALQAGLKSIYDLKGKIKNTAPCGLNESYVFLSVELQRTKDGCNIGMCYFSIVVFLPVCTVFIC